MAGVADSNQRMADQNPLRLPLYTPTKWWRELTEPAKVGQAADLLSVPLANLGISPKIGADDGTRTRNLLITSRAHQLSYVGNWRLIGFEPTLCATGRCVNQPHHVLCGDRRDLNPCYRRKGRCLRP